MTDEKEQPAINKNRDLSVRSAAIDMAIRSNCGQYYDDQGRILFDEKLIVEAAAEFETFIKNGSKSKDGQW